MKKLAIIGAGDLGKQIAHYAISDNHYRDVCFFDDFTDEKTIEGFPVLGKKNDILPAFKDGFFDEILLGIGYKHLKIKEKLYEEFSSLIPFGKIIHSTCWVDSSATVENGCVIYPNTTIDANAYIKANTIINIDCTISHDSIIGEHCFLSPRVAIAGFVKVDECCFLGINSTLIDGVCIGANIQLGGASLVLKSIYKKGLYVGSPVRFIK